MRHTAIAQIEGRVVLARDDSDFTYFHSLLLEGEALLKTICLGLVACIADDPERNRYRLEYTLLRADGLGRWGKVVSDALSGPASQFLLTDLAQEKNELTRIYELDSWQARSVGLLRECL